MKNKIKNLIESAIENYDWESLIENAVKNINIEGIITDAIDNYHFDMETALTKYIENMVEETLVDLDMDEILEEAIGVPW